MILIGVLFLVTGVFWSVFKIYVLWDASRDLSNGAGVPTLDFPLFCPLPLSLGLSLILTATRHRPFPGFGFVLYLGLAVLFFVVLLLIERLTKAAREKSLEQVKGE